MAVTRSLPSNTADSPTCSGELVQLKISSPGSTVANAGADAARGHRWTIERSKADARSAHARRPRVWTRGRCSRWPVITPGSQARGGDPDASRRFPCAGDRGLPWSHLSSVSCEVARSVTWRSRLGDIGETLAMYATGVKPRQGFRRACYRTARATQSAPEAHRRLRWSRAVSGSAMTRPSVRCASGRRDDHAGAVTVVGVRMTSRWNAPDPHDTSVLVSEGGTPVGRVVCTDIQTVPATRLLRRSVHPSAVSPQEWWEIRTRVERQLGLR